MADLQRQLAEVEASQRDLIAALNGDDALQGLFIDAMARRFRALTDESARISAERDAQIARIAEHAARVACAERLSATLGRQAARADEAAQLADSLERYVGGGTPASGKIAGG
jgi:hypothetical protein